MADIQFSHDVGDFQDDSSPPNATGSRSNSLNFMVNVTGAVLSLSLVAGIGVWGYQLVMRDVSGIPIVRAVAGEMRVRPEDPGGMQARHQGLAVNVVAAEGGAEKPADRLVLAPRPASLTSEDQPIVQEMVAPVQQPEPLAPAAEMALLSDTAKVGPAAEAGSVEDIVAQLTEGVPPIDAPEEDSAAQPELHLADTSKVATEDAIEAVLASVVEETPVTRGPVLDAPGVRSSARPRQRPANAPAVVVKASFTPTEETAEIDPGSIPTGTRLAQLGAFESAAVARAEWDKLQQRFGDYLEGKSRVVEKAQSGGRTFYRLRAMGFADLSDARRFCSTLVAEKADCIPVVSR